MPTALKASISSPLFRDKSLTRSKERSMRVLQLVCTIEPPRIASDLRAIRRKLSAMISTIKTVEVPEIVAFAPTLHLLVNDHLRVSELLLRLARVPLAPPGARANGKMQAPLDITPEIEPPQEPPAPEPVEG